MQDPNAAEQDARGLEQDVEVLEQDTEAAEQDAVYQARQGCTGGGLSCCR